MRTRILLASMVAVALAACGDDDGSTGASSQPLPGDPGYVRDPALNVELTSAAGSADSHEMGNNCMYCHQKYGGGPGLFTAAGTLYDLTTDQPRTDAVVEIRSAPAGEGDLLTAIEVDTLGNFYTTAPLPIPESELFVFVRGSTTSKEMPFPTSSLACNYCHTPAIRVNVDGP